MQHGEKVSSIVHRNDCNPISRVLRPAVS